MAGLLANSPADIAQALLVSLGVVSNPTLNQAWPAYVSMEPSTPDDCVTVKDTAGKDDGRTMVDGERQEHHGFQVRIRGSTHLEGFAKANAVQIALDQQVLGATVTIGAHTYVVYAVSTSPVLSLGKEQGTSKRSLFTINCTAALRQIS